MFRRWLGGLALAISVSIAPVWANENHDVYSDDSESALETYNRAMFDFNTGFNHYVLMPVAEFYRDVTSPFVRRRLRNLFDNLQEPVSAGNYLLQAEPKQSGVSLSRFVINSTLGLLGMFDVADAWGLKQEQTNFDDTFAKWCIPDGPFIVLPFIGPSTPRAATSMALGFVMDPVYWSTTNDANVHDKVTYGLAAVYAVVIMEENMDLLNDLEKNSVDFYATMKAAYMQNRKNKGCFNDGAQSSAASYDFDFGIDETTDY